ncbi:MAG: D-alanyl-D-alanine carboxypeptidase family protein [Eubacteriales bacterium]|nr:D-alanyl-D-alanine carboxypeptidase family protein [Eubacteriales bacterium]
MKKTFKVIGMLLVVSILVCTFVLKFSENRYIINADSHFKAMCVIECDSARKLYKKDETLKLPMASTTKIVTALTVLNNCSDLDREFEVDNRAIGIPGTSIYLKQGEIMTVRELLYGMMLPSGNDAAMALAYHISADIPSFCKLMKQTVEKCGAYNSSFDNPHGLDSISHYTTAYDLALITAKALENETFKEIVTTKATRIRGSSEGTYRYLKNKNRLLNTLNGCIGVKTGFTNDAGRCLVSACERDGFRTVCVVLNCGPMFEESESYLNMAYKEYEKVTLLPSYKIIRQISVEQGKKDFVKTFSKKGFTYPLTKDELSRIIIKYDLPNSLNAPVLKDEIIGNVEIYLDNCLLFSEKIYTMDNVKKVGVWSSIQDLLSDW